MMRVTRLSPDAHRTRFAVISLLILVLHGSLVERVGAQDTSKGSGTLIRVWTVGSPFTDDLPQANVPPQLGRQAENLGYTIEVKTFRAAGFAAKFRQALQEHNEPEVLTFGNYGLVVGISTPKGGVEGLGAASQSLVTVREALAQLQPRGWVMLVRSAVNYEEAKALSSMLPAVCGTESGPLVESRTLPELRRIQETAVTVARAYLLCDESSLSTMSDEFRLGRKCYRPESDTEVEAVKACSVSGNNNLAFVSLVGTFTAKGRAPRNDSEMVPDTAVGRQSLLAILRNQGGVWRLLAITDDPVNTVYQIPLTTERIGRLLENGQFADMTFAPARLLTENGVYPGPAPGVRFGDFTWQPAESPDVIGQVVEFMWGSKGSSGQTRLFFLSERESKISSGYLMSGGATYWRVWSISKGGEVAFSERHSFVH